MTYQAELFTVSGCRLIQISHETARSKLVLPRYLGAFVLQSSELAGPARKRVTDSGFFLPQSDDLANLGIADSFDLPLHGENLALYRGMASNGLVGVVISIGRSQVEEGYDVMTAVPIDKALTPDDLAILRQIGEGIANVAKPATQPKSPEPTPQNPPKVHTGFYL